MYLRQWEIPLKFAIERYVDARVTLWLHVCIRSGVEYGLDRCDGGSVCARRTACGYVTTTSQTMIAARNVPTRGVVRLGALGCTSVGGTSLW